MGNLIIFVCLFVYLLPEYEYFVEFVEFNKKKKVPDILTYRQKITVYLSNLFFFSLLFEPVFFSDDIICNNLLSGNNKKNLLSSIYFNHIYTWKSKIKLKPFLALYIDFVKSEILYRKNINSKYNIVRKIKIQK